MIASFLRGEYKKALSEDEVYKIEQWPHRVLSVDFAEEYLSMLVRSAFIFDKVTYFKRLWGRQSFCYTGEESSPARYWVWRHRTDKHGIIWVLVSNRCKMKIHMKGLPAVDGMTQLIKDMAEKMPTTPIESKEAVTAWNNGNSLRYLED